MKSKFKNLLLGAILVLPLALQAFTGLQAVQAADGDNKTSAAPSNTDTTTVELTKLVFPNGTKVDLPSGPQLTDLQDGKPVDGVEFQAFNITDKYAEAVKNAKPADGKTKAQQAMADLQSAASKSADLAHDFGTAIATQTTAKGGVTDFTFNNRDDKGNYQTYLIMETKYTEPEANGDNTIIQRATPLILTMPLATGKNGDKVYIYPKNFDQKTLTKDLTDNKNSSHNLGDKVNFTVTAQIPFDISGRDQYDVTDIPDAGLTDLKDSIQVKANGAVVPTDAYKVGDVADGDYTAFNVAKDAAGTGFKLQFTPAALAAFAGQTLTVTYDAQVISPVVKALQNHAGVDFGHNPHVTTGKTPITVGGAKFVKQDTDTAAKLADAVFVLENKDGKIVTTAKDTTGNTIYNYIDASKLDVQKLSATVQDRADGTSALDAAKAELKSQLGDAAANAIVTASDKDGAFEFTGLAYGDYKTVEIAAPKDYAVLTAPQSFTVNANSYTNALTIDNTHKGILPHTGGMGIYLVVLAGLVVMAGALIVLKKGRHEEV